MPRDLVAEVVTDHRRLELLLDRLLFPVDPADPHRALTELGSLLAAHTWAEESVLYPVVRSELAGGAEAVVASRYEHIRVAGTLARLSASPPDDPHLGPTARSLALELRYHIAEEESGWLASIAQTLEPTRLEELAHDFAAAKRSGAAPLPDVSEIDLDAPGRSGTADPGSLVQPSVHRSPGTASPMESLLSSGFAVSALRARPPKVVVRGEIDAVAADELNACIDEVIPLGPPLLVDLSHVTFMGARGVRAIVRALDRYGFEKGSVRVVDPCPQVERILRVTRLADLVELDRRGASARG